MIEKKRLFSVNVSPIYLSCSSGHRNCPGQNCFKPEDDANCHTDHCIRLYSNRLGGLAAVKGQFRSILP